jgi:uncharacterized protein
MTTKIFINLPVKDLNRSIGFFTSLGFTFNQQFTDETATCMIISDNIFAMLLTEKRFKDFTKKEIADAKKTTEVLLCINTDKKGNVDKMVADAIKAGGNASNDIQDYGWMYSHAFEDPDGHIWEVAWIDESSIPENPSV